MNNRIILILAIFLGSFSFAQKIQHGHSKEETKEMLKNMSPEERKKLFEKVKVERVIKELAIPTEKQAEVRQLFTDYSNSKREIIKTFKPNINTEQLSEQETKKYIADGLEVMQKVLDNRKTYTEKFLKILTPHQVLKIFKIEQQMKEEFDRKHKKNEELKMKN